MLDWILYKAREAILLCNLPPWWHFLNKGMQQTRQRNWNLSDVIPLGIVKRYRTRIGWHHLRFRLIVQLTWFKVFSLCTFLWTDTGSWLFIKSPFLYRLQISFEFRVIPIDWLPTKFKKPSLTCFLLCSFEAKKWIH